MSKVAFVPVCADSPNTPVLVLAMNEAVVAWEGKNPEKTIESVTWRHAAISAERGTWVILTITSTQPQGRTLKKV